MKVGATRFRCKEARKHACQNRVSISQKRIEAREFGRIRDASRSPEMLEAFTEALEAERRKLEASDPCKDVDRLEQRLGKAEGARKAILAAIEGGAPFAL